MSNFSSLSFDSHDAESRSKLRERKRRWWLQAVVAVLVCRPRLGGVFSLYHLAASYRFCLSWIVGAPALLDLCGQKSNSTFSHGFQSQFLKSYSVYVPERW